MKIKFKDLPIGTRFKYPEGTGIWIVIQNFGNGLIVKWEGLETKSQHQSHCSFCDDYWTLDSEVEVLFEDNPIFKERENPKMNIATLRNMDDEVLINHIQLDSTDPLVLELAKRLEAQFEKQSELKGEIEGLEDRNSELARDSNDLSVLRENIRETLTDFLAGL